jgi:hypothetical protein
LALPYAWLLVSGIADYPKSGSFQASNKKGIIKIKQDKRWKENVD